MVKRVIDKQMFLLVVQTTQARTHTHTHTETHFFMMFFVDYLHVLSRLMKTLL